MEDREFFFKNIGTVEMGEEKRKRRKWHTLVDTKSKKKINSKILELVNLISWWILGLDLRINVHGVLIEN